MTPKKRVSPARKSSTTPSLYHRLDALLHTMRCIAQHEDALCELSHDVKQSRSLTSEAIEDLRVLLGQLPSHDYLHDLEAVSALLPASSAATRSVTTAPKKSRPPIKKSKAKWAPSK